MWRYHKPSFEQLLLGELQRQQRSSVLCDTILQADGISVPAHSCVLSAISPQFSRTFSAAPPLPLGQSHLLQFQAVRAHTLLKLVGFLYSGELEGSGERERQELITAAWKLGIEGLEEVGRKEGEVRGKHTGRVTEDAKDSEDDSGEVQELGRRWEESEGLIEQADRTRGPGMMKDRAMQTKSTENSQGVCWMTGVEDSGAEDQDMDTESSYVALLKKASDSETQTEVSGMTVGGADMETQTDVSVLRIRETDRETDTGTQTDIPVWTDRETDTGTQTDIPVWMDRETDTGTQTDIPVCTDRETDTGTQSDTPVLMDRETDIGRQTDIPVWTDRETDTGTQSDTPVSMDRETDIGRQTDIPVWTDRETDTGTQSDTPVSMDRETDIGRQTDLPVSMNIETETVTQTDLSFWRKRWTEADDGNTSILPLPPTSACSTPSFERSWADHQSARFAVPLPPGVKPLASCTPSWPPQSSPASGSPPCDRDDPGALLPAGEGGTPLVDAGHVTHGRKACSVTPTKAPFTANIAAETDENSPNPCTSAHAVAPASALSDTVAPAPLIIAHHTDSIAPTPEIIASDTDLTAPAAAAESVSLVVAAAASGGSDARLLSVSEADRGSSSTADLSPVAPVAGAMAQHYMASPTSPSCPSPGTILTIPQGADLEDPGEGAVQSSTPPGCILSQGLCPLISAASPMRAQGEEHHPLKTPSSPPVQAGMDFQGAIAAAQKNCSGHFGSGGVRIVGDGVQGLDAEENREFEQFEGNIVGFINYFLNPNPSQEESGHAGVGKSNVPGHQEMAPSGSSKRGRPRKRGMVRTEMVEAEGERGIPSSLEGGCGRERIELGPNNPQTAVRIVPRGGRGRGRGRGRGGLRARQQPIKMRLKKQPEGGVWEIVDVRAETFGALRGRRGGACRGGIEGRAQRRAQGAFPIIRRQRGQPRVPTFRMSSLPRELFNALVPLPDLPELSTFPSPFLSDRGWHPPQAERRAPLPPPSPPAAPEESAEQLDKLLDDMVGLVMGLGDNAEGLCAEDSPAGGAAGFLHPRPDASPDPHMMHVLSPGSRPPAEVAMNTFPRSVAPAMASEGDFAVPADPVSLQSVTATPDASVPHTNTPVPLHVPHTNTPLPPVPHQGTTTACSHECCSCSICSRPCDEAAPCRPRLWSSSNPVSFCSESGEESIVDPKDSLSSCVSQAAGVTVSGLTCGLLQTADSGTPVGCCAEVQPNPRPGSNTERAVLSRSTGSSRATDTSLYSPPQETIAAVNDILERILGSSENESESRCVNDGDEPEGIGQGDGAAVQEEATSPDVLDEHSSKDARDVNGSKDADGPLECSEGSQTNLQQCKTPLTNIHSPVQKELTLEPEQPIKTSQDTSHILVESQISSAIHSKPQRSKDLSCCPSLSPEGLQIPSLMTEHLPADSSPNRPRSPVTKQPVPIDCSKRPTGVPGDKGPPDNRLGGRENVDAEYKKRKIVTRSQTKKNRTKEAEDGKGQTSSNRRKSVKRGLQCCMPTWERHADGTVVKRLRRSASWCEENCGELRDGTFRSAEKRKREGQTARVNLRKGSTSVCRSTNGSTCSGKKPGNFAVKQEACYSSARVCFSCTENSPADRLEKLDSYVNRLTKANKPVKTGYGTRNLTNARKHKADGVDKGDPSKRNTSEEMCKPRLITREVKMPRNARADASSTLGKSTVGCRKAKRYQRQKMEDFHTDEGRLHTRGRKRKMQDAVELKTRQGPPDKRRGAKPICRVCLQQSSVPRQPPPDRDLQHKRAERKPKERNSLLRGGKACTVRDDGRLLNSSGARNLRGLKQRKRRVMKCGEKENHRKRSAGKEEQEGGEDCEDSGATRDEQDLVNGEEVTVQGDGCREQILESRAEIARDGETESEEVPTDDGGACGSDGGGVGGTGPSGTDRVDKPDAGRPKGQREKNGETTSSGTEIQDMPKGNSIIPGSALSSPTPHPLTGASAGGLESEDEVDVLDCSSPVRVSFDVLPWSAAQVSHVAEPSDVDAAEEDDEGEEDEGEEVDVTGEESE